MCIVIGVRVLSMRICRNQQPMTGYFFLDFEIGFFQATGTREYMVSMVRWMRPPVVVVILVGVSLVGTRHALSLPGFRLCRLDHLIPPVPLPRLHCQILKFHEHDLA